MSEIPFWVHDRPKWVSGISKSTTCQDVLHALVLAERKAGANKANQHLPGVPGADILQKKHNFVMAIFRVLQGRIFGF